MNHCERMWENTFSEIALLPEEMQCAVRFLIANYDTLYKICRVKRLTDEEHQCLIHLAKKRMIP